MSIDQSKSSKNKLFRLLQDETGLKYIKKCSISIKGIYDSVDDLYTYEFTSKDQGTSLVQLRFNHLIQTWNLEITRGTTYVDHRDSNKWWSMVMNESQLFDRYQNYTHLQLDIELSNRYQKEKYSCGLVRPGNIQLDEDKFEAHKILKSTIVKTTYEIVHDPELVSYEDYTDNRRFLDLIEEL